MGMIGALDLWPVIAGVVAIAAAFGGGAFWGDRRRAVKDAERRTEAVKDKREADHEAADQSPSELTDRISRRK